MDTDPKKSAGDKKPQLQLIPPALSTEMARALQNGADKYGAWNWRENKIEVMTYIGAMRRHLDDFVEGEDTAPDSGVHHFGHVAANCAILLDAMKHNTLIDNHPPQTPTTLKMKGTDWSTRTESCTGFEDLRDPLDGIW